MRMMDLSPEQMARRIGVVESIVTDMHARAGLIRGHVWYTARDAMDAELALRVETAIAADQWRVNTMTLDRIREAIPGDL